MEMKIKSNGNENQIQWISLLKALVMHFHRPCFIMKSSSVVHAYKSDERRACPIYDLSPVGAIANDDL